MSLMVCPTHEVNYTLVCPYCQARKIAELEGEGELTEGEGESTAWSALRTLREFEEAENITRRTSGWVDPLKDPSLDEWPDIVDDD